MNKDTEKILKNFDAVWQRVTDSKSPPPPSVSTDIMPRRKEQKHLRRFEFGK